MTHLLISSLLVIGFTCILIQPIVCASTRGSSDVGGSDVDQTSTTYEPETDPDLQDALTSVPYATDEQPITTDVYSNLNFQSTSTNLPPTPSDQPLVDTLPLSPNTEVAESIEPLTKEAPTEIPPTTTSIPPPTTSETISEINSNVPTTTNLETEPATTQPPATTSELPFTTECYETTTTELPCATEILGRAQLTELYNRRVIKAQRYVRPLDSCIGRMLGFKFHCGVVVTLELPYHGISLWLIHKGPNYGNASDTVVVDASCMSNRWSPREAKIIAESKVGDYVTAGGTEFFWLCNNCRHACKKMMELN